MHRRARLLPLLGLSLLGWTMAAAFSGGGEEMRGPASPDAPAADDAPQASAPAAGQSVSIARDVTHRIATVSGGELVGSGTPGVRVEGKGGILTVTGQDDHGHPIELSVQCERFDEVVAEGG